LFSRHLPVVPRPLPLLWSHRFGAFMGLELDWLEREERYRRRVLRMLIAGIVIVGGAAGTIGFLRARTAADAKLAAAKRDADARDAAKKAQRDAWVADSTATANRYAEFLRVHAAKPIASSPLLTIPLPAGAAVPALVQRLWTEYARVADPQVSAEQESEGFRPFYIQLLNDGPLRGRGVLLPAMKQDGTKATIQKASFLDITHAQIEIGMREMPKDAIAESLAVQNAAQAAAAAANAAASTTPPAPAATTGTPPAATAPPAAAPPKSAPSAPAAQASTPSAAVPPPAAPTTTPTATVPKTTPSTTAHTAAPKAPASSTAPPTAAPKTPPASEPPPAAAPAAPVPPTPAPAPPPAAATHATPPAATPPATHPAAATPPVTPPPSPLPPPPAPPPPP